MKVVTAPLSLAYRLFLLLAVLSALLVSSNDGDLIKRGSCSGGGTYKLKLSPENGNLEIEFEVEHRANQRWNYVIRRRGNIILSGSKRTGSTSQSFTVRVVDGPGTGGQIKAVATRSGQKCTATATYS